MPIVALFKQLKAMNYQGGVMLEYEIKEDNPFAGMLQSISYMRGVLSAFAVHRSKAPELGFILQPRTVKR